MREYIYVHMTEWSLIKGDHAKEHFVSNLSCFIDIKMSDSETISVRRLYVLSCSIGWLQTVTCSMCMSVQGCGNPPGLQDDKNTFQYISMSQL